MLPRSCSRDAIDNRQNNASELNAVSFYRLVLHIRVDISRFVFVVKIYPRKDGGNHTWEGNCRTRSSLDAVVRARLYVCTYTYHVYSALKLRRVGRDMSGIYERGSDQFKRV